jgi:small Trp-rich protein
MPLVWIGGLLVLLRWLELGPLADVSWWYVLAPLGVAVLWFEGLERVFGRDRRQVDAVEWENRRKDRVAKLFEQQSRQASETRKVSRR